MRNHRDIHSSVFLCETFKPEVESLDKLLVDHSDRNVREIPIRHVFFLRKKLRFERLNRRHRRVSIVLRSIKIHWLNE